MIYEETGEWRVIMKMMILLFNIHSRRVGINQILNTYMPALQRDVNNDVVAPLLRENNNNN